MNQDLFVRPKTLSLPFPLSSTSKIIFAHEHYLHIYPARVEFSSFLTDTLIWDATACMQLVSDSFADMRFNPPAMTHSQGLGQRREGCSGCCALHCWMVERNAAGAGDADQRRKHNHPHLDVWPGRVV